MLQQFVCTKSYLQINPQRLYIHVLTLDFPHFSFLTDTVQHFRKKAETKEKDTMPKIQINSFPRMHPVLASNIQYPYRKNTSASGSI